MTTGLINSWAVNPQAIGAMYPFVGWETLMFILLVLFWLTWTIWQFRREAAALEKAAQALHEEDSEQPDRTTS